MKHLLCFGDSNTWGSAPMVDLDDVRRWPVNARWPGVLRHRLGGNWQVMEEGLPGRTIGRDDPVEGADRNALRMLGLLLESHRPLDRVIYMLGTNDLKARFGATPQQIADSLHNLVDMTLACALPRMPAPAVLLVCPPPIIEVGCLADMFAGGADKAWQLAPLYRQVATLHSVDFFDAGTVAQVSAQDGIHLDAVTHAALGNALADWIQVYG
jgi:lysophospholipase L1-like esterase